jgi:hypothetical protein
MATTGSGDDSRRGIGSTEWGNTGDQSPDRRAAAGGGSIAQTLRETTYRRLDDQKARASETLGSVASAVRGMSQPLRDTGQQGIADYVNKAADGIERWASNLGHQDIDDAIQAVQQFARRQPALFLGVAFTAGVVAARFLKSSSTSASSGTSLTNRSYGTRFDTTGGAGPRAANVPETAAPQYGTTAGDIPRLSSEIPSRGEAL